MVLRKLVVDNAVRLVPLALTAFILTTSYVLHKPRSIRYVEELYFVAKVCLMIQGWCVVRPSQVFSPNSRLSENIFVCMFLIELHLSLQCLTLVVTEHVKTEWRCVFAASGIMIFWICFVLGVFTTSVCRSSETGEERHRRTIEEMERRHQRELKDQQERHQRELKDMEQRHQREINFTQALAPRALNSQEDVPPYDHTEIKSIS